VPIDGSKNGTVIDPRGAEPTLKCADGAVNCSAEWDANPPADSVLVGLRSPDGQNDPLPNPLEVNEVTH
jgi:hypothetical protein